MVETEENQPMANLDHDQNDNHQLETRVVLVFEMISQQFNQSDTLM